MAAKEMTVNTLSRVRLILQETFNSPFTDSYLVTINGQTVVLKRAGSYQDIDLTGVDLHRAHLENVTLKNARLAGANLWGAHLTGANLEGADLKNAVLTGADLKGAVLTGADLEDAVLTGADLRGATVDRETLSKARGVQLTV